MRLLRGWVGGRGSHWLPIQCMFFFVWSLSFNAGVILEGVVSSVIVFVLSSNQGVNFAGKLLLFAYLYFAFYFLLLILYFALFSFSLLLILILILILTLLPFFIC